MSAFTSCPLAFRFSYIERLPEPPSAPASKGTLVHLALQKLFWRPSHERTLDAALAGLVEATNDLAEDPDLADLELSEAEWAEFHAAAEVLVHRYFELEDPREVHPIGLELRLEAVTPGGVKIRGIIDRLELDANGDLVISDYKTGNAPRQQWEQNSLAGVHVYSFLCEQAFGSRPSRVQLLYLSGPEKIAIQPSDQSTRGVAMKTDALMRAMQAACTRHEFQPRKSALCDYCSYREFCPQFGGDPAQAAPVLLARKAEREGRPQLPLAVV